MKGHQSHKHLQSSILYRLVVRVPQHHMWWLQTTSQFHRRSENTTII